MILLDTSGVLAAVDDTQVGHEAAARVLDASEGPRFLSPFVLAELDYLVLTRIGRRAEINLLNEVVRLAFRLEPFDTADVDRAQAIIERYADLEIGLADASIVVLAERHDCLDVLTLDARDFRALRGPGGRPFRVLPADAGG